MKETRRQGEQERQLQVWFSAQSAEVESACAWLPSSLLLPIYDAQI
jgi:hypothetical protein